MGIPEEYRGIFAITLASFFYDIAAGGAIVLISIVIFALSVLLKRFFYQGASKTDAQICDD